MGGHELKLGPVGGSKYYFVLCLGGHKIKCQIFLGDRGNRLHFCKVSLASGGGHPLIYTCYIYIRLPLHLFSFISCNFSPTNILSILLYNYFIKSPYHFLPV